MSQLIHMRQRIKTVETIKRITHAMRLISRSSHFRLNKQRQALKNYHQNLGNLFTKIVYAYPEWPNICSYNQKNLNNTLYIIVGSHKGLCGSFNSVLFNFFNTYINTHTSNDFHILTIGRKAQEFAHSYYAHHEFKSFIEYNATLIASVAQELTDIVFSCSYSQVILISNKIKNFFVYYPHATQLIPYPQLTLTHTQSTEKEIHIEGDPYTTLDHLAKIYMQATIQILLFEAFLAEQAARFISMDNATRNADTILENTRLDYNKLRQAKITKEMIEISNSY
ncbi:MAG TPA: FoF1 ATP synthase subunit gamma [Candidatus Babeliales bacterium]|nr:FoF1 ATP synthase subunit gamma [Candidatus Babeliales bacterium]